MVSFQPKVSIVYSNCSYRGDRRRCARLDRNVAPIVKELTRADVCLQNDRKQVWEFDPGEILEVEEVIFSEPKKIKTRPGKPGGRMRFAEIIPKEQVRILTHMPETAFEIVEGDKQLFKF